MTQEKILSCALDVGDSEGNHCTQTRRHQLTDLTRKICTETPEEQYIRPGFLWRGSTAESPKTPAPPSITVSIDK